MHVGEPSIGEDPSIPGCVRVSARVTYRDGTSELYWFDLPTRASDRRLASGDPWLCALLPLAATLGEPLHVEAPMDATLLEGARELLRVWRAWHPHLPGTAVSGPAGCVEARRAPGVAAMFSGGADSFHTLLRRRSGHSPSVRPSLTHLVTIHGFDIPIEDTTAFRRLRSRAERVAEWAGCVFLPAGTNIRRTRWSQACWATLAHGCALAAVGHLVAGHAGTVIVPGGVGFWDMRPWGSHPLTDPLLSSSHLRLVHDGAGARRFEKFEVIAEERIVLDNLRVCWRGESDTNCGGCSKCMRAISALHLLGVLDRTPVFEAHRVEARRLARIYCSEPGHFLDMEDQIARARRKGRLDHARALRRAAVGSVRRHRWIEGVRRRLGGRWARRAERVLLRGWLR